MFSLHTRLGCLLQLLLASLEITRTSETSRQQQRDGKTVSPPFLGRGRSRTFSHLGGKREPIKERALIKEGAGYDHENSGGRVRLLPQRRHEFW